MKLKSQLILSIIIFGIVLLVISMSVFFTNQQVAQINSKEQASNNINAGASSLAYIANDYFLYQQTAQLNSWQSQFSSLQAEISNLASSNPGQITQIQTVKEDLQRLGTVFNSSVMILQSVPTNESASAFPAFQTASARLNVQNQALAFDASVLSSSFASQADQLKQTNTILIFALLGAFGAYFVMIYFIVFRRTFRSINRLQDGTKIVGSGNLDYSVGSNSDDEIDELSRSFNQMTANLKTVTASKDDLEREIAERRKAEEAMRESEQRYSLLFNSIPEGFCLVEIVRDKNNLAVDIRYLEINDAYAKLVDRRREQIIGKTTRESFGAVEDYWYQLYDKVAKTGEYVHYENYVQLHDRYYQVYAWRADTANHVAILATNITERKKAEKAIATQAELIDLSPDAIIVRKLDGIITFWSRGAEKLYGWTKEEVIGKDINLLLKTEFPKSLKDIQDKLRKQGKWSGEIIHSCKDGSKLIVQSYWLGKLGSNGQIFEIMESNVDITDRIQLQVKLEKSAVRLEEYANQMEELANKRAEQLKDSERLATIGATAGMVGHDIRNPLQAITGDIFLAKADLIALPESEEKNSVKESLSEIEKNVDYINKIVADLQDFARPLKPNAEETDLKGVIDNLLKKNGLPENVKVTVKVETDARKVVADSTFINRIMYNLVNNAVQAMPKGGKLTIHAFREANNTVLTVKDTGVGIPETVKGKLFTPMFTTKAKGQGFGLAVIKRMTEALGGSVSFESQEGKGTTFFIRLPLKKNKT